MTNITNSKNALRKEFFQALIPAAVGSLGMSLYFLLDSFFVGIRLGNIGFATLSIGWSLITLMSALSSGIGMGGAIQYSLAMGKKEKEQAKKYYLTTLCLLAVMAVLVTIVFLVFADNILHFLKAEGELFTIAKKYLTVVSWGVIFQIGAFGLPPLVRNKGGHKTASMAQTLGYLSTIVFDYVLMFILDLGVIGCALAYTGGQMIVSIVCLYYLLKHHNEAWEDWKVAIKQAGTTIKDIIRSGISPSGVYFSSYFVSTYTNIAFLTYGDSVDLAAYMVVMTLLSFTSIATRGFLDGAQPLISRNFGEGEYDKTKYFVKWLYQSAFGFIFVTTFIYGLFKSSWGDLFGITAAASIIVENKLLFCISGYLLICFSRITLAYLYAISENLSAAILTYGEGALTILLMFILPKFFGIDGVWLAIILAFAGLGLLAISFRIKNLRKAI